MKSHWIEHQGKRVFIVDFSKFDMEFRALRKEADEVIATLQKEPPNSVRAVTDVTDTAGFAENVVILKDVLAHTKAHVYKRCVIGVEGLRWYFIRIFNQITGAAQFQGFPSMEKALDWIVKD